MRQLALTTAQAAAYRATTETRDEYIRTGTSCAPNCPPIKLPLDERPIAPHTRINAIKGFHWDSDNSNSPGRLADTNATAHTGSLLLLLLLLLL